MKVGILVEKRRVSEIEMRMRVGGGAGCDSTLHVYVCVYIYTYIYVLCVLGAHTGKKRTLAPSELELQKVVHFYISLRNGI